MTNILKLRPSEEVLIDFDDSNCPTPATLVNIEPIGEHAIARFSTFRGESIAAVVDAAGSAWSERGEVIAVSQADYDSPERWQCILTGVKAHFANGGS